MIDLHGGPRSSWLTWATGAPQRIGYDIQGRSWLYTRTVHRPRGAAAPALGRESMGAADGARRLAGHRRRPVARPGRDGARRGADARHRRAAARGGRGDTARADRDPRQRRQPVPAMARAGVRGARRPGWRADDDRRRIVLSSGPSDRTAADRIAGAARQRAGARRARSQVLDFGDFDLAELRALVERSRLFVGGDTGPLHIAATTPTPIVGIYGPTLAARSAPWRDPRHPDRIGASRRACPAGRAISGSARPAIFAA